MSRWEKVKLMREEQTWKKESVRDECLGMTGFAG
jgi:hypothetical protein